MCARKAVYSLSRYYSRYARYSERRSIYSCAVLVCETALFHRNLLPVAKLTVCLWITPCFKFRLRHPKAAPPRCGIEPTIECNLNAKPNHAEMIAPRKDFHAMIAWPLG